MLKRSDPLKVVALWTLGAKCFVLRPVEGYRKVLWAKSFVAPGNVSVTPWDGFFVHHNLTVMRAWMRLDRLDVPVGANKGHNIRVRGCDKSELPASHRPEPRNRCGP